MAGLPDSHTKEGDWWWNLACGQIELERTLCKNASICGCLKYCSAAIVKSLLFECLCACNCFKRVELPHTKHLWNLPPSGIPAKLLTPVAIVVALNGQPFYPLFFNLSMAIKTDVSALCLPKFEIFIMLLGKNPVSCSLTLLLECLIFFTGIGFTDEKQRAFYFVQQHIYAAVTFVILKIIFLSEPSAWYPDAQPWGVCFSFRGRLCHYNTPACKSTFSLSKDCNNKSQKIRQKEEYKTPNKIFSTISNDIHCQKPGLWFRVKKCFEVLLLNISPCVEGGKHGGLHIGLGHFFFASKNRYIFRSVIWNICPEFIYLVFNC